jgi:hypothetical protein
VGELRHPSCNLGNRPHILVTAVRSRVVLVSSLKASRTFFVFQPNAKKR